MVWNTTGNPILSDYKTIDGNGIGSFVSSLTDLYPNTFYYIRAYASNALGVIYGNQYTFSTDSIAQPTFDIDGNNYKTIKIGTQIWMSENLRTTKYRNGSPITNVTGNSEWQDLKTGAWSYYNNNDSNNTIFGKLYNWYATQGDTLCPLGWHVPSDEEWSILINYVGGESVAGGKMKSVGTVNWNSANTGATNESGFSVFPAGFRDVGGFKEIGNRSDFWSSTSVFDNYAWSRNLKTDSNNLMRNNNINAFGKLVGTSIRCIKDQ